ncbi:hypothetical protein [Maridesulfovibrio sp.]|uniref:carboxymuconolactone decarboxylase family protein n=1 Tax=Maridesulfovibrio sp. TaxID=2795000 RepID=UPI002A189FFC|nr:hypothetical protein [Maridesulfovibrio sp.]
MLMINCATRENAEGKTGEFYARIPESLDIPTPVQVMSASAGIFERHAGIIEYFGNHENLEFPILASIRYMAASLKGYTPCIDFNSKLLISAGLEEAELETIVNNPLQAPFEKKECLLLGFVRKGILSPETINREDLQALKDEGWTEEDLVDALYHAASMDIAGTLSKAFTE